MRTSENIVSSFFFYMWNAWCEEECRIVFASVGYPHFWEKWGAATKPTVYGAAEKFYAELSVDNRTLLVNRACEVYNGSKRRSPSSVVPDEERFTHQQTDNISDRVKLVIQKLESLGYPFSTMNHITGKTDEMTVSIDEHPRIVIKVIAGELAIKVPVAEIGYHPITRNLQIMARNMGVEIYLVSDGYSFLWMKTNEIGRPNPTDEITREMWK